MKKVRIENLHKMNFNRKFSVNFHKNLKLKLAEMSFSKDFINDQRGDLYPLMQKLDCQEQSGNGFYKTDSGTVERLLCSHFPYATYEMRLDKLNGSCGFGGC